jgi:phosphoglucomutase
MNTIEPKILEKAQSWLIEDFDETTRNEVARLIAEDPDEVVESFYRDLEFGTGGLRGIMGVGSNRMNKYTVGMATQGLANYLLKSFPNQPVKIAIAYDSRNNSSYFAQIAAEVLSANDIRVYLFDKLRPTPELSFTVRHLGCQGGIVITASHNPKEYNGYKVYWNDGGQLVAPHDKNVILEVNKISSPKAVNFIKKPNLIEIIGTDIDHVYLQRIGSLSLNPEIVRQQSDLKIVYTPIHGTGIMCIPQALERYGFKNVNLVNEQAVPDGNFPTVKSPNPEERAAMTMAIALAQKIDADVVMASDPDADRVGVSIKDPEGNFILLNGNQTASVLFYYVLNQWDKFGKIKGKEFIVKTIVTSDLLKDIAESYHVESFDVLTGFKFIAEKIKELEGQKQFIIGGEESYGYLVGDFVRDKDAVSSCCMIAETAAWAKSQGKTMYDILLEMYLKFGLYVEDLISITKKGKSGAEEIARMMADFRSNPPKQINRSQVIEIRDYKTSERSFPLESRVEPIHLPKSDVLQFFTEEGSKITVRPSGTEPKIKFYFGIKGVLSSASSYAESREQLTRRINAIVEDLKLN